MSKSRHEHELKALTHDPSWRAVITARHDERCLGSRLDGRHDGREDCRQCQEYCSLRHLYWWRRNRPMFRVHKPIKKSERLIQHSSVWGAFGAIFLAAVSTAVKTERVTRVTSWRPSKSTFFLRWLIYLLHCWYVFTSLP